MMMMMDSAIPLLSKFRNFKSLPIFCGCAARFVSDQVRNQNVGFLMTQLKYLAVNNKCVDQTLQLGRLICTFVVGIGINRFSCTSDREILCFTLDDKFLYYVFIAILMLFLVIFKDDKSDNFLRGDKSFRTLKRTKSRQMQNK